MVHSTQIRKSRTKAVAISYAPMDITCCDSGTPKYSPMSIPLSNESQRCSDERNEKVSRTNDACGAYRQSRRKIVLHPNPPPTWEEGIRSRDRCWLPCGIWLVRECELVAVEVRGCLAALRQLAE